MAAHGVSSFPGILHVVDLDTVDRKTEYFDGRDWLVHRTLLGLPIGWDLMWQANDGNPVALMQFADDTTALLLRTDRSGSWLPNAVITTLMSEHCAKVVIGYGRIDKIDTMQRFFNLQPSNVKDLSVVAERKGLAEKGFAGLCKHFGVAPRKHPWILMEDWTCDQLSAAQIQYAADDAYIPFRLNRLIEDLPDVSDNSGKGPECSEELAYQSCWRRQNTQWHDAPQADLVAASAVPAKEEAAAAAAEEVKCGDQAEIFGLESEGGKRLNGKVGVVREYIEGTGRFRVDRGRGPGNFGSVRKWPFASQSAQDDAEHLKEEPLKVDEVVEIYGLESEVGELLHPAGGW